MSLPTFIKHYREAKSAHPGMVVLFANGDFYELFEADAEMAHRELNLTLTTYQQFPMAGFTKHKLEHYVGLLLKGGHRVAVCEMVSEKPKSRRKAS